MGKKVAALCNIHICDQVELFITLPVTTLVKLTKYKGIKFLGFVEPKCYAPNHYYDLGWYYVGASLNMIKLCSIIT